MTNKNDHYNRDQLMRVLEKLGLIPVVPKSYNQILNDMMGTMTHSIPNADMNQGSVMFTLLETIAKELEKTNARIDDLL